MPLRPIDGVRGGLGALIPLTFAPELGEEGLGFGIIAALATAAALSSARGALVAGGLVVGLLLWDPVDWMAHHRWLLAWSLVWVGLPVGPERALDLVRLQASAVYGFGALDKLETAWLSGARLVQILVEQDPAHWLVAWPWSYEALRAVALVTPLLQLALALGLWHRRTFGVAVVTGILFHLTLEVLVPVGTFGLIMGVHYGAFAARLRGG